MLQFYKNALLILICLLIVSLLLAVVCVRQTFLHVALTPAAESTLNWVTELSTDANEGGISTVEVQDDKFSLSFDFTIKNKAQYPFVTVAQVFTDPEGNFKFVDLSRFETLSFSVKCAPANILFFAVYTIDDKITKLGELLTYKTPSTYFSCTETWSKVELDLTRLETPQWWFELFDLDPSQQEYDLEEVHRITFSNSFQSPTGIASTVRLDELTLNGRDWHYMYVLAAGLFVLWGGYLYWFFRQHTRALVSELQDKMKKDRPLVAYQHLTMEPRRDQERSAILRYMNTKYSNPELNLDAMGAEINITRSKINDILKSELGYTFISYLNKLRLTEAARLLNENKDANVAEIAYLVGYKNVSYFIKLFKEEYGCTPKTFRSLSSRQ